MDGRQEWQAKKLAQEQSRRKRHDMHSVHKVSKRYKNSTSAKSLGNGLHEV